MTAPCAGAIEELQSTLKVLESVSFFLGGKKCRKIVNIGVMRKDRAAQQILFSGTILRGLTQPLNAYGYKYFSLLLLLFYPFVVLADLSQQAKSAAADGLTYSDSIDKKSSENLNLSTFCPLEKN
jgi:hypothetical protein